MSSNIHLAICHECRSVVFLLLFISVHFLICIVIFFLRILSDLYMFHNFKYEEDFYFTFVTYFYFNCIVVSVWSETSFL